MNWFVGIFYCYFICASSDSVVPHSVTAVEESYQVPEVERSVHNSDFGRSMRSFTVRRFNQQLEEDSRNAEFFPRISSEEAFIWTEPTPLGTAQLGHTLHRGEYSVVFAARINNEDYIIKYRSDCDKLRTVHPLLTDAWYSSMAPGVAVGSVFVSPGVRLDNSISHKTGFGMTDEEMRRCRRVGSRVRYTLMRRVVGTSLTDLHVSTGVVEFRDAIIIFRELILALEKIHKAGFVHGKICPRHVMVTRDPIVIRLIDFSAAQFVPTQRAADPVQPTGYRGDPEMSPWEIRGYQYGPRDDIYRAVRVLAVMLNEKAVYAEHESRVAKRGISSILDWKLKTNFFVVPGSDFDPVVPIAGIRADLLTYIHAQLAAISAEAQGMEFQQQIGLLSYNYFVERSNAILSAIDHLSDLSYQFPSDVWGSGDDVSI